MIWPTCAGGCPPPNGARWKGGGPAKAYGPSCGGQVGVPAGRLRRDVGGGNIEIIETHLPAVISAQVGLNEPRYATALNIIKAKKKPIETLSADDLGITEVNRKTLYKNFELPPPKQPCRFIEGSPAEQATELVRVLMEDIEAI